MNEDDDIIEMVDASVPYVPSGRGADVGKQGILGMFNQVDPSLAPSATRPAVNENFNMMPMSSSGGAPVIGTSSTGTGYKHPGQHNANAFPDSIPDRQLVSKQDIHDVWKLADSLDVDDEEHMFKTPEEAFGINKVKKLIHEVSEKISSDEEIRLWLQVEDAELIEKMSSVGSKLAKQLEKYLELAISASNKVG